MKRLYDFLREKGFYLALGVGIVAFAALIFLYDYKDAGNELTREQAIDLNKARSTEELADSSDARVKDTSSEDNSNTDRTNNNTSSIVAKDDNKNAEGDVAVQNAEGADGEEVQNIRKVNSEEVAGNSQEEKTVDADANINDNVVETASDGALAKATEKLDYDGSQGLLWPLNGDVIMPFSMDTTIYYKTLDIYKCNSGIMIAADEGNSVFSAYEGVVESVKDTKEYGTELTVNLGNGYKAIYGQLMNVAVKPGDEVAKATIIGQVAPVSDYFKKEGTNLFFKITKDDKPVNPVTLIE